MITSAASKSTSITLWTVNHEGKEVRCDLDWSCLDSLLPGTAHVVADGAPVDSRPFTTIDELIALTADWHQQLALAAGARR